MCIACRWRAVAHEIHEWNPCGIGVAWAAIKVQVEAFKILIIRPFSTPYGGWMIQMPGELLRLAARKGHCCWFLSPKKYAFTTENRVSTSNEIMRGEYIFFLTPIKKNNKTNKYSKTSNLLLHHFFFIVSNIHKLTKFTRTVVVTKLLLRNSPHGSRNCVDCVDWFRQCITKNLKFNLWTSNLPHNIIKPTTFPASNRCANLWRQLGNYNVCMTFVDYYNKLNTFWIPNRRHSIHNPDKSNGNVFLCMHFESLIWWELTNMKYYIALVFQWGNLIPDFPVSTYMTYIHESARTEWLLKSSHAGGKYFISVEKVPRIAFPSLALPLPVAKCAHGGWKWRNVKRVMNRNARCHPCPVPPRYLVTNLSELDFFPPPLSSVDKSRMGTMREGVEKAKKEDNGLDGRFWGNGFHSCSQLTKREK